MVIFLYLAFLITALYWVAKILLPEMNKVSLPKIEPYQSNEPANRIAKLETLLAEKSKNIQLLQTELQIFIVQIRDFDKVKTVLEEEIHHLREQNRMFRSELGLPAAQPKENSVT